MTVGKDVSALFPDVANCMQVNQFKKWQDSATCNGYERKCRSEVNIDISNFTKFLFEFQTDNLELKKLVYLYLMNYAKSQPDMAIMAVNTFVKDCEDPNPLIRALAVRTMGCIRVDKITEYLCQPVTQGLVVTTTISQDLYPSCSILAKARFHPELRADPMATGLALCHLLFHLVLCFTCFSIAVILDSNSSPMWRMKIHMCARPQR